MPRALRRRRVTNPGVGVGMGPRAKRVMGKVRNVGELVSIGLGNPGRKKRTKKAGGLKNMATRKRSVSVRRRRNPVSRRRVSVRRRNPLFSRKASVTHRRRRRNPDFKDTMMQTGGVLGGAALTGIITGLLPANLTGGAMGLLVIGGVAYAQGMIVGNVTKNKALGDAMTIGGLTVLALNLISKFIPNAGGLLPIGLKGLGHTYVDAKTLPPPMVGQNWLNYPMGTYNSMPLIAAAPAKSGVSRASW